MESRIELPVVETPKALGFVTLDQPNGRLFQILGDSQRVLHLDSQGFPIEVTNPRAEVLEEIYA